MILNMVARQWQKASDHPVKRLTGAIVLFISILLIGGALAWVWMALQDPEVIPQTLEVIDAK